MRKLVGIVILAVLVAAVATPALASTATAKKPPVKNAKVDDDQYLFAPQQIRIKRGTEVVWKWVDGHDVQHNIVVKRGPIKFHSGKRFRGTFAHLFNTKGTYHLYCTIHTFMTETVIVK